MSGMDEYYTILGIPKTSGAEAIKDAFFQLLAKYRNQNSPEAEELVKKVVNAYESLRHVEVTLRSDNTVDMIYEKNTKLIKQYNTEGNTVISEIDKKGNEKKYYENGNLASIRLKSGLAVDYYPDGENILKKKDKFGNAIFYRPDQTVNMVYDAKKKLQKIYKEDGKTLKTTIDAKGNTAHYWPDGKHVFSITNKKGTAFYAKDGKTLTSFIDKAGNETVFGPNRTVALKKFADGKIVEYDESGKKPKVIIDIYGRTVEHLPDGSTEYRRRDGSLMRKDDDKGNINIYEDDGITLFYSRSNTGLETYYQDDGINPLYTKDRQGNEARYYEHSDKKKWSKDKYGNENYYQEDGEHLLLTRKKAKGQNVYKNTFYKDDGQTRDYVVDEKNNYTFFFDNGNTPRMKMDTNNNKVFLRSNGKDILYTEDNKGNKTYFDSDKKKLYTEDRDGNKTYYRIDGETKWFTETPNKDRTYFKDDGEIPDYVVINGKKISYKNTKSTQSAPKQTAKKVKNAVKNFFTSRQNSATMQ